VLRLLVRLVRIVDAALHFAALQLCGNRLAQYILKAAQLIRHAQLDIQITMVNGAQFQRQRAAVEFRAGSGIAVILRIMSRASRIKDCAELAHYIPIGICKIFHLYMNFSIHQPVISAIADTIRIALHAYSNEALLLVLATAWRASAWRGGCEPDYRDIRRTLAGLRIRNRRSG